MTPDFTLSYCAVSLAALGMIYYYFVVKMRPDVYRAEMRRIRDDLFDYMWQNGHDYDNPAYHAARERLNNLLRASNRLSITTLVLAMAATMDKVEVPAKGHHLLEDLPPGPLKDKIHRSCIDAMMATFNFVFFSGLKGLLMRGLIWAIGIVRATGRWRQVADGAVGELVHRAGQFSNGIDTRRGRLMKVG